MLTFIFFWVVTFFSILQDEESDVIEDTSQEQGEEVKDESGDTTVRRRQPGSAEPATDSTEL